MAHFKDELQPSDTPFPLHAQPLAAGLYVVGTPIGNLGDISFRARMVLSQVDEILAEDTRTTLKLLTVLGIKPRRMSAYHDHSPEAVRERVLERLAEGASFALVSEAGTPTISDPGFKLVRAIHDAGGRVIGVPGPCAATLAMSVAGLPTDRFLFAGFLPPKSGARRTSIAELAAIPASLVFYETGPRLPDSLRDLAELLGPRDAAICRELTKMYEEVRRGTLVELAAAITQPLRGEIVLVIAPPVRIEIEADDSRVDLALRDALQTMSVKAAADQVAEAFGLSRRTVYQRALTLKAGGTSGDD